MNYKEEKERNEHFELWLKEVKKMSVETYQSLRPKTQDSINTEYLAKFYKV